MIEKNIKLRPLRMDDLINVIHWSKDEAFCSANGWEKNRDEDELYQWWTHCVNNVSEDFIRLGIELDEQLIGYSDLACIKNNTAEIGIAIGDSKLWGKGLGYHTAKLMMEYASRKLGITTLNAETHETNIRSIKMLEKLGFQEISREGAEQYLGVNTKLIQYRVLL